MSSSKHFKTNRYLKEDFIGAFQRVEGLSSTIYLDIANNNTIEIYLKGDRAFNRDYIEEILNNIEIFNEGVEKYCEGMHKRSTFGGKFYFVELAWILIEGNRVRMRYFGEAVNIELEAVFVKHDTWWIEDDIYYC